MENLEENLIEEKKNSTKTTRREGFEMSTEQAKEITSKLSKLDDAITHDRPIIVEDLEDLSKIAKGTKIDVGGEIMTVEEAEKIPDLEKNIKIWQEIRNGDLKNTYFLTYRSPKIDQLINKQVKREMGSGNFDNIIDLSILDVGERRI